MNSQYPAAEKVSRFDPLEIEKSIEEAVNIAWLEQRDTLVCSELLQTLITMLAVRDESTWEHSLRVTHLAMKLADATDLSLQEKKDLYIGALLHDIGKVGIPDRILYKPAPLTEAEYEVMKCHAEIGAQILVPSRQFRSAIPVVLCHHERYDGRGYPYGLKSEEISLPVRILTIADAFEAMISDRPYRRALGLKVALREIENQLGKQFDPDLGCAFVHMMSELGLEWMIDLANAP